MIRLTRLVSNTRIADKDGQPTLSFQRYWQSFAEQIERALTAIGDFLGITEQLQEAINQAQQAAQDARDAADSAQAQADAAKRETALQGSYIDPASVITASPTTITIASHTRYYPQPSGAPVSVSVAGGSAPATAAGETDYVSYVDPERDGGAVAYIVSTTQPTQTGDTHVVGAVVIPATGSADGGRGPLRPGNVEP